jgi:hypothetical protein
LDTHGDTAGAGPDYANPRLAEGDGDHTWPCYISSLICKTPIAEVVLTGAPEQMHAALEVNIPNYATAILSAEEIREAISTSTA